MMINTLRIKASSEEEEYLNFKDNGFVAYQIINLNNEDKKLQNKHYKSFGKKTIDHIYNIVSNISIKYILIFTLINLYFEIKVGWFLIFNLLIFQIICFKKEQNYNKKIIQDLKKDQIFNEKTIQDLEGDQILNEETIQDLEGDRIVNKKIILDYKILNENIKKNYDKKNEEQQNKIKEQKEQINQLQNKIKNLIQNNNKNRSLNIQKYQTLTNKYIELRKENEELYDLLLEISLSLLEIKSMNLDQQVMKKIKKIELKIENFYTEDDSLI